MPSTRPSRPSVVSSRDRDGQTVMAVAISNRPGEHATLHAEDFARIISAHGWTAWFINDSNGRTPTVLIRSRADRRQYAVARLVMGEPKGRMVVPVDGDLLNLRKPNLITHQGSPAGQRRSSSKAPTESEGSNLGT